MANLVLLKADDKQKVWKNYTRTHGVYALTFGINDICEIGYPTSFFYVRNVAGVPEDVQLRSGMEPLFKAMFLHNLVLDNKNFRLLGRFVKIGSNVLFEPLTEQF